MGRAETEAESLRPSQAKADGRRGKAKARQAEKTTRRPRAKTAASRTTSLEATSA